MAQFMSERITAIVKIRSKERIIQKQLPATKARSGRQTQRRLTNTQFNFRIVENINIRPCSLRRLSKIQINNGIKRRHNRAKIGLILSRNGQRLNQLLTKTPT